MSFIVFVLVIGQTFVGAVIKVQSLTPMRQLHIVLHILIAAMISYKYYKKTEKQVLELRASAPSALMSTLKENQRALIFRQ